MPILWVVENLAESNVRLAQTLQGEFPIRAFASIASFLKLLRISSSPKPDACLIVLPNDQSELKSIERQFHRYHPVTPCFFLSWLSEVPNGVLPSWPKDPLTQIIYVRTMLEDIRSEQGDLCIYKDLILDSRRSILTTPMGKEVSLSPKELRLLRLLMQHATAVISRESIQDAIWGEMMVSPRTLDVHISRLRKHLDETGVSIQNIYGDGYLLR